MMNSPQDFASIKSAVIQDSPAYTLQISLYISYLDSTNCRIECSNKANSLEKEEYNHSSSLTIRLTIIKGHSGRLAAPESAKKSSYSGVKVLGCWG